MKRLTAILGIGAMSVCIACEYLPLEPSEASHTLTVSGIVKRGTRPLQDLQEVTVSIAPLVEVCRHEVRGNPSANGLDLEVVKICTQWNRGPTHVATKADGAGMYRLTFTAEGACPSRGDYFLFAEAPPGSGTALQRLTCTPEPQRVDLVLQ